MLVDVVMPKMGESIQEGKILRWMKKPGDKIDLDESILEISTDKVDSEIPSPSAGVLSKIVVAEGETVEVGTVIAIVETNQSPTNADHAPVKSVDAPARRTPESSPKVAVSIQDLPIAPAPEYGEGRFYSPLVRSMAKKEGVALEELHQVGGSGIGGRVTKNDLLAYLQRRSAKAAPAVPTIRRPDMKDLQQKYPAPLYDIIQMDNVQMKMSEHMVHSVHTSPHVEAISECDVTAIVEFRASHADRYEQQEGFKFTFTPFFVYAATQALKDFPIVNSSVEGDKIILKKSINVGMAVAAPSGLIVPVIKNAGEKSFLDLSRSINDIAARTRSKRLQPDEILGGTFTITNYGVFGNIIGTPIINQPQVAILGIGAIKKRPVVLTDTEGKDTIGIRSITYLTLAFDHRIIDGAIGGQFLARVVENLERFDFSKVF
jgi:pyruvate/2-oxoglutarate dehydrogenase complex dihydrolipoamide acyltransferase (E2) component